MDDDYGEEVLNKQLDSFSFKTKTPVRNPTIPIPETTPKTIFSTKPKPLPPNPERKPKAMSLEDLSIASVAQRQSDRLPPPSIFTIANLYLQLK